MTTRTAKYLTAVRAKPDRAAPIIARTEPGREYCILSTRLVGSVFWNEIPEGWVAFQAHGVFTWRAGKGEGR